MSQKYPEARICYQAGSQAQRLCVTGSVIVVEVTVVVCGMQDIMSCRPTP